MGNRSRSVRAGAVVLVLAACGGGGGGGGFPHTAMALDSTVFGELASGDVVAPDNSFLDFYVVEPTVDGVLTVTQRSAAIDSFTFLFTANCLNDTNLANWGAYLLALDDDSGGGVNGFDATFSLAVTAGSYVIAANSFGVETGPYSLEAAFAATDGPLGELSVLHLPWADAKTTLGKTH